MSAIKLGWQEVAALVNLTSGIDLKMAVAVCRSMTWGWCRLRYSSGGCVVGVDK